MCNDKPNHNNTNCNQTPNPQFRPSELTGNTCGVRDDHGNACGHPISQHFDKNAKPAGKSCSKGHSF